MITALKLKRSTSSDCSTTQTMDYFTQYTYWLKHRGLLLSMITGLVYTHASYANVPPVDINADEYSFDESLFKGSHLAIPDISRFNKAESIAPGSIR